MTLTPAAIAKLREMLGNAQLPWTSKLFGVTRGASWGHIAISAVNALPALLDAAEEVERLKADLDEACGTLTEISNDPVYRRRFPMSSPVLLRWLAARAHELGPFWEER